jgi:hypothetical protein
MCFPKDHYATATGVAFNPVDPQLDRIRFKDIAVALSNNCRWGGHTEVPYTIAQHSVMVLLVLQHVLGRHATLELRRQALMHDASEAYLLDMPAPIKAQMPEYRAIEDRLQRAIAIRFGLHYPWACEIHLADKASMIALEAPVCQKRELWFSEYLCQPEHAAWVDKARDLKGFSFQIWSPREARGRFVEVGEELGLL